MHIQPRRWRLKFCKFMNTSVAQVLLKKISLYVVSEYSSQLILELSPLFITLNLIVRENKQLLLYSILLEHIGLFP